MQYVWITYLSHDEDDPAESYVELGDDLRERRTQPEEITAFFGK